jgi:hypothetical protein
VPDCALFEGLYTPLGWFQTWHKVKQSKSKPFRFIVKGITTQSKSVKLLTIGIV